MKVKFLKDYKHIRKTFKKGDVVELFNSFAEKLIKKKVVEKTDEVTSEEIIVKKIMEDRNDND